MSGKKYLFQLIKALDKPEKRYVRLFISKNSIGNSNKYLLLFDAYSKQKDPDESKLKKLVTHFAVTKHYLYEIILRALASYHSESSTDVVLSGMVHRANLLFEKKLFQQCGDLARKGMKMAEKHDVHLRMIELMDLELRSLHALVQVKELTGVNERYLFRKKEVLAKQEQIYTLQKYSYDSFIALKTKWVKEKKDHTDELVKEKELSSNTAKILYHQILSARLFTENNTGEAFAQLMKLDKIFEENPSMVYEHLNQYIAMLNNMNLLLFDRNDFDHIKINIEKMRAIKTRSTEKNIRVRERLINVEMNVYKNTGEFEKGKAVMKEAEELLSSKKLGPVYRMLFQIVLCTYNFAFEEYRSALKFLNLFLNESNVMIREDLQKTARILNMILHYELSNFDYFESLLRSSKRFFKKIDTFDEMEKLFLAFFPKAVSAVSDKEKNILFEQLYSELSSLSKNKIITETYFHNFNFIAWAEAKFRGKTYIKTISDNYTSNSLGSKKNQ